MGSTLAAVAVALTVVAAALTVVAADSAGMDEAAGFREAAVDMAVGTAPILRKRPASRKRGETSLKHPIT